MSRTLSFLLISHFILNLYPLIYPLYTFSDKISNFILQTFPILSFRDILDFIHHRHYQINTWQLSPTLFSIIPCYPSLKKCHLIIWLMFMGDFTRKDYITSQTLLTYRGPFWCSLPFSQSCAKNNTKSPVIRHSWCQFYIFKIRHIKEDQKEVVEYPKELVIFFKLLLKKNTSIHSFSYHPF